MSGNYSTHNLAERAAESYQRHASFVAEMHNLFVQRQAYRRSIGCPVIAVLGNGRAGKDTASKYMCVSKGMTYCGSSSNFLNRFVADLTGLDERTSFSERHEHREYWIATGHAVRAHDLSLFARMILATGDLAVGLRGREEIHGCLRDGIVDALLWIDNNRVTVDITMELQASDCDIIIPNHGSYTDLYRRLDRFLDVTKWPSFGKFPPTKGDSL
jgi:hypothetical protein